MMNNSIRKFNRKNSSCFFISLSIPIPKAKRSMTNAKNHSRENREQKRANPTATKRGKTAYPKTKGARPQ